jgi:acetyl esterase/lipase
MSSPSYRTHENAQPLDKQTMAWFFEQYLKSAADKKDPRIDLVNAKLNGLPPTTIVSAEIDPLYSDAKALELELREAGVVVENKTYADMTHGFFGLVSVLDEAEDAVDFASSRLEETFDKRAAREAAAPKR